MARYAPLAGVLAVALWFVGVFLATEGPGDGAAGAELAADYDVHGTRILLAASFLGLGSAAFVWFLASLASTITADLGDGRLGSIVLASGTAGALAFACVGAPGAAAALATNSRGDVLDPAAASALHALGDGFLLVAEFVGVAFVAACALAALRGAAFPRWFGWTTVVLAILLALPPLGWAALLLGMPAWTLVASVMLFRRDTAPDP